MVRVLTDGLLVIEEVTAVLLRVSLFTVFLVAVGPAIFCLVLRVRKSLYSRVFWDTIVQECLKGRFLHL